MGFFSVQGRGVHDIDPVALLRSSAAKKKARHETGPCIAGEISA